MFLCICGGLGSSHFCFSIPVLYFRTTKMAFLESSLFDWWSLTNESQVACEKASSSLMLHHACA